MDSQCSAFGLDGTKPDYYTFEYIPNDIYDIILNQKDVIVLQIFQIENFRLTFHFIFSRAIGPAYVLTNDAQLTANA